MRYFPAIVIGGILLEIASLIWVGAWLGVLTTLLLVIAGAFIGTSQIRRSGLGLVTGLNAARDDAAAQMAKAGRVFLVFLSGLLFISPGFFSDVVAVVLLLPPVQQWLASHLKGHLSGEFQPGSNQRDMTGIYIEGEAIEIDEEDQSRR